MWAQLPHPLAPKETGLASQAGAPSFTLHSLPKPSEFLPCLYPWTPSPLPICCSGPGQSKPSVTPQSICSRNPSSVLTNTGLILEFTPL